MSRLSELKKKYGLESGEFEPNPKCRHCRGTGEKELKHRIGKTFCVCLFVGPEFSDSIGQAIGETAKKLREEMDKSQ